MPPGRPRHRAVTNENDENAAGTMRMTRAQSKALGLDDPSNAGIAKKPLQTKKSTATLKGHREPAGRKRAALGDVSNVAKGENADGKEGKTKGRGLTSKATQHGGVQKLTRANSSRSALGPKDANKKAAETDLKRPASGSGIAGRAIKKRNTSSKSNHTSLKQEPIQEEERKHTTKQTVYVEVENRAVVDTKYEEVEEPDIKEAILEPEIPDLDAEDYDDPLMVSEYVVEIFEYLHKLEIDTMPNPNYMDHQEDIEWKMRGILIDWLIEVHTRFHLLPETLFLAVNIIDRFLSNKVCQLDRLQLVGVTAMFIASKYEEVLSPHVANFRHVTDNGFSEDEILSAERFVLQTLNYDLSFPNPMNFLRRISKADNYDIQTRTLGKYLMEVGLVDHRFIKFHPSRIAAASMYFARLILERGPWDATLAHYSGYTEEEIMPVFKLMVDYLHRPVAHEALFKKYASKKFLKASILIRQWAKKYHPMYLNGSMTEEELEALEDFQ